MNPLPPDQVNPLNGTLAPYAGHGTFIAGVVRQRCPSARILGVPIFGGDGVVTQSLLTNTLVALLIRQSQALATNSPDLLIDVLSLSLGYYYEDPSDAATDAMLRRLMTAFGQRGVAVVAAAGNDATLTPFHPAAFAGQVAGFDSDAVPLVSVGALNPNGEDVAYFSNAGPWVSTHRLGANLISTMPTDLNGDRQSSVALEYDDLRRATIDPDDFTGGFGTWSGTSFAAPVMAGELAQHLAEDQMTQQAERTVAVERGWRAVNRVLPHWSP